MPVARHARVAPAEDDDHRHADVSVDAAPFRAAAEKAGHDAEFTMLKFTNRFVNCEF
jgi:hypothetical protein